MDLTYAQSKETNSVFNSVHLNLITRRLIGASMFKAIEGEGARERFEEMSRIRISLARKLWNISCCELNGFNQTAYLDE